MVSITEKRNNVITDTKNNIKQINDILNNIDFSYCVDFLVKENQEKILNEIDKLSNGTDFILHKLKENDVTRRIETENDIMDINQDVNFQLSFLEHNMITKKSMVEFELNSILKNLRDSRNEMIEILKIYGEW